MKVIAKVLDVTTRSYQKDGVTKQAADIVCKSGSTTIDVTMFDGDVGRGKHLLYDKLVGQQCILNLSPEVYRGNLNYRLGFDDPKPVSHSAPTSKAKAA
ncbi:hypothetical protein MO867_17470 [Microbulbifer sp. OS29]|uniref:Uncharacterized protein n=1 Tax=Microbulbifer okhotskensis TaxID=2926617 RepID=A0A9X2EPM6_9GAMM|nr:hypothetical protein [Microbulbifer okhotskensis]MCO1336124.1 hypothetical protein [Microbulbifer okhotskensis]